MQRHGSFANARLTKCTGNARKTSPLEAILPVAVVCVTPVAFGFRFGQKALVAFQISTVGTSFVIETVFSETGEIWANSLKLIELVAMGEENGRDSKWHEAALITDAVRRSLKKSAGSAMNVVMKLVVLLCYLAIQQMLPNTRRGWIGGIVFVCS